MIHRKILLLTAMLALLTQVTAQVGYQALNYSMRTSSDWHRVEQTDSTRQSSFYPNITSDSKTLGTAFNGYIPINKADSLFLLNKKYQERSWFHRKLLKEHFIIVDTGLFYLTVDPLFNVSAGAGRFSKYIPNQNSPVVGGYNNYTGSIYNNTRGILLKGDIGSRLSFESYFYENQSRFPGYIDDFVNEYNVVPGQGRVKNFKMSGFDFAQSGGYLSYAPGRNFNVQFGHHKHFVGDGYRSLFLSDNSFNYPFLRSNLWFFKNRVNYSVMYTSFQNLNRLPTPTSSEAPFERKAGSFHFLQVQATKWLRLNLFQGMIWKTMDTNGKSDIDYNMFNPVMFVNPALYGLDDRNNALLGFGFKADLSKKITFYGQYALDDYETERFALQAGAYYFLFKSLRLQAEFNHVQAYTYAFPQNNRQAYTHYNEGLAHPLGTGFDEFIVRVNYRYRRILLEAQMLIAKHQIDPPNNRSDVFESDDVTVTIPPTNSNDFDQTNSNNQSPSSIFLELAYLINPATNVKVFLNGTHRVSYINYDLNLGFPNPSSKNIFIYFGLRTDLRNLYYDF
ncbi:MAG: hypothetical protein RIE58_07655 [Vicingaceae bacterium]